MVAALDAAAYAGPMEASRSGSTHRSERAGSLAAQKQAFRRRILERVARVGSVDVGPRLDQGVQPFMQAPK